MILVLLQTYITFHKILYFFCSKLFICCYTYLRAGYKELRAGYICGAKGVVEVGERVSKKKREIILEHYLSFYLTAFSCF